MDLELRKRCRRTTEEDRNTMVKLYADGYSVVSIGKHIGFSILTVYKVLTKNRAKALTTVKEQVPVKSKDKRKSQKASETLSESQKVKALDLFHNQHWNNQAIGDEIGATASAVKAFIKSQLALSN